MIMHTKIKRKNIFSIFFLIVLILLGILVYLSFQGPFSGREENIKWGITFSKLHTVRMGLDWQQAYLAIMNELQPSRIRIPLYWNDIELKQGEYDFSVYEWMVNEATIRDIGIVLVVGRRTPRWPECHDPVWHHSLIVEEQKKSLLAYVEASIIRFKDNSKIVAWQVENEPFVEFFGECPVTDEEFFEQEVALARLLDASRPIIITDSGEYGYWYRSARYADILGTTMYRRVPDWPFLGEYNRYFFPPQFYRWKGNLIDNFVPIKNLIVAELQGEPWVIGTSMATDRPLEEQYKTMNPAYFEEIIQYARASGIGEMYWWGAEWWYWLKLQGHIEIWESAKQLFNGIL